MRKGEKEMGMGKYEEKRKKIIKKKRKKYDKKIERQDNEE